MNRQPSTIGEYINESETWEYSREYYDTLKECYELILLEHVISAESYVLENAESIDEFLTESLIVEAPKVKAIIKDKINNAKDKINDSKNTTKDKISDTKDVVSKLSKEAKTKSDSILQRIINWFRAIGIAIGKFFASIRDRFLKLVSRKKDLNEEAGKVLKKIETVELTTDNLSFNYESFKFIADRFKGSVTERIKLIKSIDPAIEDNINKLNKKLTRYFNKQEINEFHTLRREVVGDWLIEIDRISAMFIDDDDNALSTLHTIISQVSDSLTSGTDASPQIRSKIRKFNNRISKSVDKRVRMTIGLEDFDKLHEFYKKHNNDFITTLSKFNKAITSVDKKLDFYNPGHIGQTYSELMSAIALLKKGSADAIRDINFMLARIEKNLKTQEKVLTVIWRLLKQ